MTGRNGAAAEGLLARHGRRMARWRWVVIPLWLLILVAAVMLAGRVGDVLTREATLPGSEAERGQHLIERHFADGHEYTETQPVFRSESLTVDDPEYRAAVTASLERAAEVVPGTEVVSYFTSGSRDMVGDDGHLTFATLRMPLEMSDAKEKVPALREALGTPAGFEQTLLGGDAASWHDLEPVLNDDLAFAEMLVLPIALLVLLLYFRTVPAALLPLLTAGATVMLALAGTWAAGQALDIAEQAVNVITLVGIAIGIDYALLIVSRFREEMAAGAHRTEAAARTMATAGRAVLLSGTTVAIGLAVLVALPVPFIQSIGIGGLLVPLFAVITALTALPAVLVALGRRLDWLPVYPRRWRPRRRPVYGTLARLISNRFAAVLIVLVAALGLGALATNFTSMSTHQDQLADSIDNESTQAGLLIRDSLGGAANPNVYVIDTGRAGGVYDSQALRVLGDTARELRGHGDVVSGVTWPDTDSPERFRDVSQGMVDSTGRYALMNAAPLGDTASSSGRALNDLMEEGEGRIESALPGSQVTLTGAPAAENDFNEAIYGPFPYLVLAVLALTFLALARAFRSWLIPLISVLVTGLTLLATYGLMTLVFQEGHGLDLLGMDHEVRGIASWVPLFVFAFLFGISMDYQVFLVERMRELKRAGHSNALAVRMGLRETGRVIFTAATIMVAAFAGFVAGSDVSLKEFGFALAAAAAIDAIVVRSLLVPALMRLTGERNWSRRESRAGRRLPAAQEEPGR